VTQLEFCHDLWHWKTTVYRLSYDIVCMVIYWAIFSARCNIYISHLCYDVSVRLSVAEVHRCIIANLGFKFRSKCTAHCGWGIIAAKSRGIISRYASHC